MKMGGAQSPRRCGPTLRARAAARVRGLRPSVPETLQASRGTCRHTLLRRGSPLSFSSRPVPSHPFSSRPFPRMTCSIPNLPLPSRGQGDCSKGTSPKGEGLHGCPSLALRPGRGHVACIKEGRG